MYIQEANTLDNLPDCGVHCEVLIQTGSRIDPTLGEFEPSLLLHEEFTSPIRTPACPAIHVNIHDGAELGEDDIQDVVVHRPGFFLEVNDLFLLLSCTHSVISHAD